MTNIIRNWMNITLTNLLTSFNSYINTIFIVNICSFTALLLMVIMLYFIYWRNFEDNLNTLLQNSIELLNIIPEIIKFHLVKLLKEEHFDYEG